MLHHCSFQTGYIRALPENTFEMVVCDPTGLSEVFAGTLQSSGDELILTFASTSIMKVALLSEDSFLKDGTSLRCSWQTPSAKVVDALTRVFTIQTNALRYTLGMKAVGQPMQARL